MHFRKYLVVLFVIFFLCIFFYTSGDVTDFWDFLSYFSFFFFLYEILSLIGIKLPVKELIAFIYITQILFISSLIYNQYPDSPDISMSCDKDTYYEYAIPCILLFCLGLFVPLFKYSRKNISDAIDKIIFDKKRYSVIGYNLIIFSIAADFFKKFDFSEIAFIIHLGTLIKFIGIYYLWIADAKYKWFFVLIIFVPFALETISGSIFIELFIWSALTYSFFQLKNGQQFKKNCIVFMIGGFIMFTLQTIKPIFRQMTWVQDSQASQFDRVGIFFNLLTSIDFRNDDVSKAANSGFLGRLNQGRIVGDVLNYVPYNIHLEKGYYFKQELFGIFVPRIFAPDKISVGSHDKFSDFTNIGLAKQVAMSVSILGDGFGNFGYWGGILFCLFNGLFINYVINLYMGMALKYDYSIAIWIPFVFLYAMRCGDEFYIITNHIVKSSLFLFIIYKLFLSQNSTFYKNKTQEVV